MPTLAQKLLLAIQEYPGATDRYLADLLLGKEKHQAPVNLTARRLSDRGSLVRKKRDDGRWGNFPLKGSGSSAAKHGAKPSLKAGAISSAPIPSELLGLPRLLAQVAKLAGVALSEKDVRLQYQPSPHKRPSSLPTGMQAVYCFLHGTHCLKVGKAGPKSGPRFVSQHYFCKAPSTLAKSILFNRDRVLTLIPAELHNGFNTIAEGTIGLWIEEHTTRLNILIPESAGPYALSLVEAFMQCKLKPVFEG